jgi:DNA invertase Pin-like site-specific DNA recombinase
MAGGTSSRAERRTTRARASVAILVVLALVTGATGALSQGAPPRQQRVRPPSSLVKRYPLGKKRLCCRSNKRTATPAKPGATTTGTTPPRRASRPERSSSTASSSVWPVVVAAVGIGILAATALVVLGRWARQRRRRSRRLARIAAWEAAIGASVPSAERVAAGAGAGREVEPARVPAPLRAPSGAVPAAVDDAPEPRGRADRPRALGYVSVPGARGSEGDLEARAQIAAIEDECERRGLKLEKVVHDSEPTDEAGTGRPGLSYALDRLTSGEASFLVVSRLERLSRSIVELGAVFEWFAHRDATLIVIDHGIDTSEPAGRLTANVVIAMSSWEHDRLAEGRRREISPGRSRRQDSRPAVGDIPALKERIVAMRDEGMTLQAIADQLNEEGVPTLRGGAQWRPSSVQSAAGYKRPRRDPSVVDVPPSRPPKPEEGDE